MFDWDDLDQVMPPACLEVTEILEPPKDVMRLCLQPESTIAEIGRDSTRSPSDAAGSEVRAVPPDSPSRPDSTTRRSVRLTSVSSASTVAISEGARGVDGSEFFDWDQLDEVASAAPASLPSLAPPDRPQSSTQLMGAAKAVDPTLPPSTAHPEGTGAEDLRVRTKWVVVWHDRFPKFKAFWDLGSASEYFQKRAWPGGARFAARLYDFEGTILAQYAMVSWRDFRDMGSVAAEELKRAGFDVKPETARDKESLSWWERVEKDAARHYLEIHEQLTAQMQFENEQQAKQCKVPKRKPAAAPSGLAKDGSDPYEIQAYLNRIRTTTVPVLGCVAESTVIGRRASYKESVGEA